jgi:hypothetical protein
MSNRIVDDILSGEYERPALRLPFCWKIISLAGAIAKIVQALN